MSETEIQHPHPLFEQCEVVDVHKIQIQDLERRALFDLTPNVSRREITEKLAIDRGVGKYVAVPFDRTRQLKGYVEIVITPDDVKRVERTRFSPSTESPLAENAVRLIQAQLEEQRGALERERAALANERAEMRKAHETAALEILREERSARKEAHERLTAYERDALARIDGMISRAEERATIIIDEAEERGRTILEQADADAQLIRERATVLLSSYQKQLDDLAGEREKVREEAREQRVTLAKQEHALNLRAHEDRTALQLQANQRELDLKLAQMRQEFEAQLPSKKVREEREMRQLDRDLPPRTRLDTLFDTIERLAEMALPVLAARGILPPGFVPQQLEAEDEPPLAEVHMAAEPPSETLSSVEEIAPESVRREYPGWDGRGAPPLPPSVAPQDVGVTKAAQEQLRQSYGGEWDGKGPPPLPKTALRPANGAVAADTELPPPLEPIEEDALTGEV